MSTMRQLITGESGDGNPVDILVTVIILILTVYVAYAMVSQFSQNDPNFGKYGWAILGALVVGVIAFFKGGGLFK